MITRAMDSPHGGALTESRHEVATLAKARKWYAHVDKADLPVTIEHYCRELAHVFCTYLISFFLRHLKLPRLPLLCQRRSLSIFRNSHI